MKGTATGLVIAGVMALAATGAEAANCQSIVQQADTASDIQTLEDLTHIARRECEVDQLKSVEEKLGRAHFNIAMQTEAPSEKQFHLERAAISLGPLKWRAFASLGDLAQRAGEYDAASQHFQNALVVLQDTPGASAPPGVIKRLLSRANATRALAPGYRSAARSRSGAPGGVAARSIGGVEIEEIPFPIEFEYDSDVPTPNGMLAVQDMFEIVRDAGLTEVLLIGHTDPEGSAAYNQELSERRARAIASMLSGMGLQANVRTAGVGETRPPELDDPSLYTETERHQIMRRVVLDVSS